MVFASLGKKTNNVPFGNQTSKEHFCSISLGGCGSPPPTPLLQIPQKTPELTAWALCNLAYYAKVDSFHDNWSSNYFFCEIKSRQCVLLEMKRLQLIQAEARLNIIAHPHQMDPWQIFSNTRVNTVNSMWSGAVAALWLSSRHFSLSDLALTVHSDKGKFSTANRKSSSLLAQQIAYMQKHNQTMIRNAHSQRMKQGTMFDIDT